MNWSSITLGKYQQIEELNNQPLSEIDKVLFSTCIVFDMTEFELDNSNPKKVEKMLSKLTKIFATPFNEKAFTKIGKYIINYDISKITLGQYIELAFFLNKPIQNAHYILATLSKRRFRKHTANDHRRKADYFFEQPVEKAIGAIGRIIKNFESFNNEYKTLFGGNEVSGDSAEEKEFNKRYGWIYSATQVAQHEGVKLDDAFVLPIRQAFNALGYLKAKGKYELEQLRKNTKQVHNGR